MNIIAHEIKIQKNIRQNCEHSGYTFLIYEFLFIFSENSLNLHLKPAALSQYCNCKLRFIMSIYSRQEIKLIVT